jgi:hypothetical protein
MALGVGVATTVAVTTTASTSAASVGAAGAGGAASAGAIGASVAGAGSALNAGAGAVVRVALAKWLMVAVTVVGAAGGVAVVAGGGAHPAKVATLPSGADSAARGARPGYTPAPTVAQAPMVAPRVGVTPAPARDGEPARVTSPVHSPETPRDVAPRVAAHPPLPPTVDSKAVASSAPVNAPPAVADPAPPDVSVMDEARLLREADIALQARDFARATLLLDDHARRFPRGVLGEERDAERVLVLCATGQVGAATALAQRFLQEHAESPLAARVRSSCATP